MLNRLARAIDLDRAVLWGLSGKMVGGLAGPITAVLIAYCFSPQLQGYYYTMLSLLALQLFVELGLTSVIVTFASHEWARLTLSSRGQIEGDPDALSRLSGLARFGFRWFAVAATILALLLLTMGFAFLSTKQSSAPDVAWHGPWIWLCIATALNILLVPAWAILQGCNQIEHINYYRFVEAVLRAPVMWIALLTGAGLWTSVIVTFTVLLWALRFLWTRYRIFFASLHHIQTSQRLDWQKDVLPLQWRLAVSALSGYFVFALFTPALFYFQGAIVAGQMGMTWVLIQMISSLAGTWMQIRVPEFGALIAQRRFQELDRVVRKAGLISFAVACSGALLMIGLMMGLDRYAPELRARFLPIVPIIVFVTAEALLQIGSALSSYLRAFKQEPFMVLSVVSALIVGIATIVCAKYFDVSAVSYSYLAAMILSLSWSSLIFARLRKEWTSGS